MVSQQNLLSKKWTSCTSELSDIRKNITDVCLGLHYTDQEINCIVLAIDEACTNIVRYAYNNCSDGVIKIDVLLENTQVVFRLQDFAEKVSKDCIKIKKTPSLEPGGLGVELIHKVMDSVAFVHTDKCSGNILELKKNLPKRSNKNEF